jgi:hypothetical protein
MGDSTPSGSEDDQVRVENVIEGGDSFGTPIVPWRDLHLTWGYLISK